MIEPAELSQIIDLMDDCVIVLDFEGRIKGWNTAAEIAFGLTPETAIGRLQSEIIEISGRPCLTPPVWEGREDMLIRGAFGLLRMSVAARYLSGSGSEPASILETFRPIVNAKDEPVSPHFAPLLLAPQVQVVTMRLVDTPAFKGWEINKTAFLKRLHQETGLLQGFLQSIIVERSDGSLTAAKDFWPVESVDAFTDILAGVTAGNGTISRSCTLLDQDGQTFEASITASSIPCSSDEFCILMVVRNVSVEQKELTDLKDSELRYKHVFDNLPIAMAEVDSSGLARMFESLRNQGVQDLATYIESHPEFINDALRVMRVERVNSSLARLMGAGSEDEMLGDLAPYWDVGLPVLRQSLVARFRGEEFFHAETKLRRLDGGVVDVLFSTARHGYLQDRAVCSFVDLTDRIKSEQSLRRSERRYQDLFQAMTVSFWELDLSVINDLVSQYGLAEEGDVATFLRTHPGSAEAILKATTIVDVNDQTLTLFRGTEKSSLLGKLDLFWSNDHWETGASAVLNVLISNSSVSLETRLRRLDGTEFDAQFTLWFFADDRHRGLAAVTDITERVQAYQRLEESEQRFRDLFQHLPVPVLQVNSAHLMRRLESVKTQGTDDFKVLLLQKPDFLLDAMENTFIENANDAAMKLLGVTDRESLKGPITPLFQDHADAYARILQNRFHDRETYEEEISLTTFDGRELEGNLTVTFMPSMKSLGVTINAFVDTTEKKRAERRLKQIEAEYAHAARISMLGELTASIAHEVNQPLAAITTYGEAGLQWLNAPDGEVSLFKDIMSRIVADARRAANIIARIRSMASHRMKEQDVVALNEVVAEALQFLKYELQAHNVKITHLSQADTQPVNADRIQLQQVVVNLVVNAVQAISGSSSKIREVLVKTFQEGEMVHCSIEDSGPGLSEHEASNLFDTFFSTKERGMGMGLSISRTIIEGHDGIIRADNESTLGGARFCFSLPQAGIHHA